jgi:hypothetical protein
VPTEAAPVFEVEDGTLDEFQQDAKNANIGTERGRDAVQNSLLENKFAGAIIVDKNGNIIGGNKTQQAAIKSGFNEVKIIKTDGAQAIAIQRTDLDIDSPEGRRLAIALNRTAELGLQWDEKVLSELAGEGIDFSSYFTDVELQKLCSSLEEEMPDDDDLGIDPGDEEVPQGVKQFNLFIAEEIYQQFCDKVDALMASRGIDSATDLVISLVMAA